MRAEEPSSGPQAHGAVFATTHWSVDGQDWSQGSLLMATGYIVEAKGGPAALPLLLMGSRTDQVRTVPGAFLNPATLEVIGYGALGRLEVLEGFSRASHAGLCKEQGCGIWDPATGAVTAMGTQRAANGDLIYWVADGGTQLGPDGKTAVFDGAIHFVGGTGRFDAAVGGFDGYFTESIESTGDPLVSLAKYSYRATGTIRY